MNDASNSLATPVAAQPRPVFASDRPVAAPDRAAALFGELVAHAQAQTPFALAVTGPAGAGKSSFLEAVLTRAEALAAAAKGAARSPFVSRLLAVRVDAAGAAADPAGTIASSVERALRRADAEWSQLAAEAGMSLADPHAAAREAGDNFDAVRRRLDDETRDLEAASGRRARLADLLLYETAGSKVDSYARGNRSRLETALRRFGFTEADATVAYKNLVGEVAELGGGAAATPMLLRSLWAFRGQKRLLVVALVFGLIWIGLGLALESQAAWAPALREQGQMGASTVDWLVNRGWLATLRAGALAAAALALALNVWRAIRFATPLLRGARLLKTDMAERAAELDRQIETRASRLAALRREADGARALAEESTRRAGQFAGRNGAPASALAPTAGAETFLAALDEVLVRQGAGARMIIALDGLDRLAPADALATLEAARRLLGARHWALLAAFDPATLGTAMGAVPAARRAAYERLFQAGWRLDGAVADSGRAMSEVLGASDRPPVAPPPPDAARSLLDEPLSANETELLARLAPLAGASPRAIKRFANLYRLARLSTPDRAAVALMLAVETGAPDADAIAVARAVAAGDAEPAGDPRVVDSVRAARHAAGGDLGVAQLMAARRLARRLAAMEDAAA